jgi:ribose-phosphate pyrophosphokinase
MTRDTNQRHHGFHILSVRQNVNAANALIEKGAVSVNAYCTHGVFSGEAHLRIANSKFEMMTITDSISSTENTSATTNIRQISIANLLATAMDRIHKEKSVSSLFE